jgi:hypothetical protein
VKSPVSTRSVRNGLNLRLDRDAANHRANNLPTMKDTRGSEQHIERTNIKVKGVVTAKEAEEYLCSTQAEIQRPHHHESNCPIKREAASEAIVVVLHGRSIARPVEN